MSNIKFVIHLFVLLLLQLTILDNIQLHSYVYINIYILAIYILPYRLRNATILFFGYFPKALYHFCQRPQGCVDNILFYCVQGKGYYTLDGHTFTLNPNQYSAPNHG